MGETVKCECKKDIAIVTMDNRPVNSFTRELIDDFLETCDHLRAMRPAQIQLGNALTTGESRPFLSPLFPSVACESL